LSTEIPVKPQTSKSPRQTREFAWRITPTQSDILKSSKKKLQGAKAPCSFSFKPIYRKEEKIDRNPFIFNILQVTHLY